MNLGLLITPSTSYPSLQPTQSEQKAKESALTNGSLTEFCPDQFTLSTKTGWSRAYAIDTAPRPRGCEGARWLQAALGK